MFLSAYNIMRKIQRVKSSSYNQAQVPQLNEFTPILPQILNPG